MIASPERPTVFLCFCLTLNILSCLVQHGETIQDPNLLMAQSRAVFAGDLKLTVNVNGFTQMYSQHWRSDGSRETREELPLGTNQFGEINDVHHKILILNPKGFYEIYPSGRMAIHDSDIFRSYSRFAGVVLSNDPFFISRTVVITNQNISETAIEIEMSKDIWGKLKTHSETPFKTVYWLDRKTSLPDRLVVKNRDDRVLTEVKFLLIEPNPKFGDNDFLPEKDTVVFSGLTVNQEAEAVSKVPFVVGRIAKIARFRKNPVTPSLLNVDPSKRVATNMAFDTSSKLGRWSNSKTGGLAILIAMLLLSVSLVLPMLVKLLKGVINK